MKAMTCLRLPMLSVLLVACTTRGATPTIESPLGRAAAQATAIVQSAQATALVLRAQAQATALIGDAAATRTPLPSPTKPTAGPTGLPDATLPAAAATAPAPTAVDTQPAPTAPVGTAVQVQVLSVVLGAEGGFVVVNFMAPPEVATRWYQGAVSVQDEASGARYSEIGVLPVVGPLFGRPVEPGQPGYVMFVNAPKPLGPGAVVTVVLGDYRFEHIPVE